MQLLAEVFDGSVDVAGDQRRAERLGGLADRGLVHQPAAPARSAARISTS